MMFSLFGLDPRLCFCFINQNEDAVENIMLKVQQGPNVKFTYQHWWGCGDDAVLAHSELDQL